MLQYGRRNIACLTIAPTGSTSIMTQTTSGIESVFMPVYKRRRKINSNEKSTASKVAFVDEQVNIRRVHRLSPPLQNVDEGKRIGYGARLYSEGRAGSKIALPLGYF